MHLSLFMQVAMAALSLFACLASTEALSQSETQKNNPVATKPAALEYRSELENYQRYSESAIKPWRQANDTVRDVGGWRTYAKEMPPAVISEPQEVEKPQESRHGGHQ